MNQKIRLDKILLDLGYVTEEQIKQALQRQKSHGGRFGSHLVYYKSVTEEQLAHALSLQQEIPAFNPDEQQIQYDAVKRVPAELAERNLLLPIEFDREAGSLSLAIADPGNTEGIDAAKRMFHCVDIDLYIAPESLLRELITRHYHGEDADEERKEIIELPELFDSACDQSRMSNAEPAEQAAHDTDRGSVLMVSRAPFLAKFLTPIFEREGLHLHVLSGQEELTGALKTNSYDFVLVSGEEKGRFRKWIEEKSIPAPSCDVIPFTTVSNSILENPAPYSAVIQSLHRSLRIIAELRCRLTPHTPPYELICRDLQFLAEAFGMSRLAQDALHAAALLVVPQEAHRDPEPAAFGGGNDPFPIEIHKTIEYARSLHFPWCIEDLLVTFFGIYLERKQPSGAEPIPEDTLLAARLLAIVWHRHTALGNSHTTLDEHLNAIKTGLRNQSEKLAPADIIETYIRIIEQSEQELREQSYYQLFIVGEANNVVDLFATRLKHMGYHPVRIYDLEEAQRMCSRIPPTAVFVHSESFPDEVMGCKDLFKSDSSVLLYAISIERDPRQTLELFDAGYDDVFAPPHDFNIIAARLRKSFQKNSEAMPDRIKSGGFRAGFKALSFTDLVQALGQSQKSVRIRLTKSTGDKADIYMKDGRLVHAESGTITGEDAVYEIIKWDEDGEYIVEPEKEFPPATIEKSNESILMEGCKLLDESLV